MSNFSLDRREFVQTTAAALCLGAAALTSRSLAVAAEHKVKLKKAVKFGMINIPGSIEDKFNLIKELGFAGVEMDSPSNVDVAEAVAARDKTGIQIHGVVDSIHWNVRLSDPNPEVREKGLEALKNALKECKTYGGTTVLLVPGKVADPQNENYDQVWERSAAEVRKALPTAHDLGIKIAIETVWNNFITKPEEFTGYIDQFNDPMVGAYFDISNMVKFGPSPARWIRVIGKRLLKFDFKGFKNPDKWVGIGEGDENWPEVLKALDDVGYTGGYATAEVGGGGRDHLADVSARMDKILELK